MSRAVVLDGRPSAFVYFTVMRRLTWISLSTLLVLAGLVLGCGSGNPIAPPGTILTVTAQPARISLSGQSQILVEGRRPDGNRLPEDTEIRFSTNLGTITPIIAQVGPDGRATATLRADGRSGTATVTVTTGTGAEGATEATTDVLVGESPDTAPTVRITVNPDNVPVGETSTATVTIIARNPDGTTVQAGLTVILETTLGSLDPRRPLTDDDGTATSILTAGDQAGTAEITATVGASEVATTNLTIRDSATDISVQANPRTVPPSGTGGQPIALTAFVTNSQGQGFQGAPVTFEAQRGSLSTNGVVFTDTSGVARNQLTITQEQLQGLSAGDTFTVTATTPLGTGELISATTIVEVQ